MILLSTNAQNIFWLGRYLTRIQYLCSQFPFKNNTSALDYAHAFCLPAFDAASLNEMILDIEQPASFHQQFQNAKNNIYDLRGVISTQSFAELNQLLQQAEKNAGLICDVCDECNDVLEAEEDELLFLFFSLGQKMEQLDRQIRLKQKNEQTLRQLDGLIESLDQQGMASLPDAWIELKKQPDSMSYYHFSDHIDSLFELVRL
ncbi:MAG: alpha-E domain-containing protein [Acinetobacter sp.]